jgi:5-methylcytosine-specific restriction endonuclease McrA
MTKPISRKMAVDCLLWIVENHIGTMFCTMCQTPVRAGQDIQFDHIHADVFDGPHEYQNLRPLHATCHRKKSAQDVKDNAKIKRILANKPSKRPMAKTGRKIPSRKFSKRVDR